jgi:nitrous oxide reductase accessory protein NosL
MKRLILLAVAMSTALAGCASNKAADEPGTRIRDSTMTAQDTMNLSDTATHIRDSVPDSTSR